MEYCDWDVYRRALAQLAVDELDPRPCKKCGYPVQEDRPCSFCGDFNPSETFEQEAEREEEVFAG